MKKIFTTLTCFLVSMITLLSGVACGGKGDTSDSESSSATSSTSESTEGDEGGEDESKPEGFIAREKQQMPTAEIVDTEYDYGDSSTWSANAHTSVDLGYVYLQDVIDDNVYDWGHSVIKEDGKYKMWWVRPASYDAIFYAESTDLKNWTNVQRVICLSPNSLNRTSYDNIKGMLGKPSVVHVGDTYYMYFEAPATEDPDVTQTVLEWDNQVMLATSSDGIKWDFYCDSEGEPTPVVAMESGWMKNFNNKNYGVGQPSVFYKDGLFHLSYCCVIYSENIHEIRYATSTDGKNFGATSTHTTISSSNGLGFTYNSKTNKYMMCSADRYVESDTIDFTSVDWTTDGNVFYQYDKTEVVASFGEFVRNAEGIVDTETFYTIHLQGKASLTNDWRGEHTTWDGYIHAVNPAAFGNRTITLPNGAAATENNLKGYRNRQNSYAKVSADAIYAASGSISVDGQKDDAYTGATKITVSRPVYGWGSNISDSWSEVWVAWNEEFLYVYADVYDGYIDVSYPTVSVMQSYMRDSFDIFIDPANEHSDSIGHSYSFEQYMVCLGANNTDFVIKGSNEYNMTDEFETQRHRVRRTDFGYSVELQLSWHEFVVDYIVAGHTIGMDFSVNDNMGGNVGREAIVAWSDHTGNSFRYIEGFGDVYLLKN